MTMRRGKLAAEQSLNLRRCEVPIAASEIPNRSHDQRRQTFRYSDEQLIDLLRTKPWRRVSRGENLCNIGDCEAGDLEMDFANRLLRRRRETVVTRHQQVSIDFLEATPESFNAPC